RKKPPRHSEPESSGGDYKPLKVKSLPQPYSVETWAKHGAYTEKRQQAVDLIAKAEKERNKTIDLSGLGLQGVHPHLVPTSTQVLSLARNDFVSVPSEVTRLSELL